MHEIVFLEQPFIKTILILLAVESFRVIYVEDVAGRGELRKSTKTRFFKMLIKIFNRNVLGGKINGFDILTR